MYPEQFASRILEQEALGFLQRLEQIKPFSLQMPMVKAASVSSESHAAIERHISARQHEIKQRIQRYLNWLLGPGQNASPAEAQRRLRFIRLRFNSILSQFDIFSDALTQRCEHENGIWLAGLDVLASDALDLPGHKFEHPSIITYLDRGFGAAIRRVRTRLPGGSDNPVAIIRVPRERMVGNGIGSSLVHEVGHQGSAILNLIHSVSNDLQQKEAKAHSTSSKKTWRLWRLWISEILADFWSVGRLGVSSTLGLIGVVSLPRPFVFRFNPSDPHPPPYLRVQLSCAMGNILFPHPQWKALAKLWKSFYSKKGLGINQRSFFALQESTIKPFVQLITDHQPSTLDGKSLREAMSVEHRQPVVLQKTYVSWQKQPLLMRQAPPTLVFAVLGQAKIDGRISAKKESQILAKLLKHWAHKRSLHEIEYSLKPNQMT